MTETVFPVKTLDEALSFLRRPFAPAAVHWKILTAYENAALVVAYMDARLVEDRLDHVVGEAWHDDYADTRDGLLCTLTVCGVSRKDVGEGTGKARVSDALKRAAVKFGVGRSLYAIPTPKLYTSSKLVETWESGKNKQGRPTYSGKITDKGRKDLRERYARWLTTTAGKSFGPFIDHGDDDAEGIRGDVEGTPDLVANEERDDSPFDQSMRCPERSDSLGRCTQELGHTGDHASEDGVAWSSNAVTPEELAAKREAWAKIARLRRESAEAKRAKDFERAQELYDEAALLEAQVGAV